jgi:hypothetical protein
MTLDNPRPVTEAQLYQLAVNNPVFGARQSENASRINSA